MAVAAWAELLGIIGPSEVDIHAMGDRLVSEIEAWRSKHGRYPWSLSEAGLVSPARYKGGFRYDGSSGGFTLRIGEPDGVNRMHAYFSDGFGTILSGPGWFCPD